MEKCMGAALPDLGFGTSRRLFHIHLVDTSLTFRLTWSDQMCVDRSRYGRCDLPDATSGTCPPVGSKSDWNVSTCSCDTAAGKSQETEIRHQIRRLSHHPAVVSYDAVNEAGGFGLFSSFVMTIVAHEDPSRVIWPASPSQGWASGIC
jgi:hypothetical protein